jgi:hypothetical protein
MGPAIACPFEISGRGADVTNLRTPSRPRSVEKRDGLREAGKLV